MQAHRIGKENQAFFNGFRSIPQLRASLLHSCLNRTMASAAVNEVVALITDKEGMDVKTTRILMLTLAIAAMVVALPAGADSNSRAKAALAQGHLDGLMDAQQTLRAAEAAGAARYATTLYDDATMRVRFAEENWNSSKKSTR